MPAEWSQLHKLCMEPCSCEEESNTDKPYFKSERGTKKMRKLASVRQISSIRPIDGANRIAVAQVDGWECVVQKNEFQEGDYIVYIEVDSVVPERPEFEFMRDRKFRVKTIRLRGQVSQGLVLPMSILPKGDYRLGTDVTDILGVEKYDPEAQSEAKLLQCQSKPPKNAFIRFMMRFKWYRRLFTKYKCRVSFPDWIHKTDETRIQNLTALFEAERDNGTEFSVTEKMDGQSVTYYLRRTSRRKHEFGVCSRNIYLGTPDGSSYWMVARKYGIEGVLKKLIGDNDTIVMQGEICGSAIQGNKYHLSGYELFVFNLIYPDHKCTTAEIAKLCTPLGLKTVPILEEKKTLPSTTAELVEYSKGNSVVCKGQKREGIVMRNVQSDISFKVINPDFLLEGKD